MSLVCPRCERIIGKTRIVIGGLVVCPICVYKDEHPDADHSLVKRKRGKKIQKETLFDPEGV